jgi:hypothetical protein
MDPTRLPQARSLLAPEPQTACYLPWLRVVVIWNAARVDPLLGVRTSLAWG